MLTPVFILFKKNTTRHWYYTKANKQRIVSEYEQENVATREALAQLQGQMGTILKHLQAQRDNVVVVNVIDVVAITIAGDTALVMVDLVDTIVQLVVVIHPLFQTGPSRFVAAYPWGIPHNYTPQFSSGNTFVTYHPFVSSSSNRNSVVVLSGSRIISPLKGLKLKRLVSLL